MQSRVQGNGTFGGGIVARVAVVIAVVCAIVFGSVAANAQGSSGRILGVVTDQSGGNVGGATVTITDVQ